MRDALKSFNFVKKVDEQKGIFLFYQIAMKMLFYERIFKWKIFMNCNFADFAMKILCISYSYWIKTNLAGRRLRTVHNYTFKSFLLFTFLD